ncbi:MAG: hypothetical protein ACRC7G_08420 [Beijerinckiaceae bacterium]
MQGFDWGIDPERVQDIAEIVRNRRLPVADAEHFALAIVGGAGQHADSALWEMGQVLLGVGFLLKDQRMAPRDAAIAALLDESGLFIGTLKRGKSLTVEGFTIAAGPSGLSIDGGGEARQFAWSRVRRALAMADFLFNSPQADPAAGPGLDALRDALDHLFLGEGDLTQRSKRAVQAPARFMRGWRKRYLPLQAFAEMIRCREAYLAEQKRTRTGRDLAADDVLTLWHFALAQGETWSFARYVERLAALVRAERADGDRRAFMQPAALDATPGFEPSSNPEEAIIAWLDRTPTALDPDEPEDEPEDTEETEGLAPGGSRALAALARLPSEPKVLNGEERRVAAEALAILPLAHEQPPTWLRVGAVAPWENRLVEASRRGTAQVAAAALDYAGCIAALADLDRRLGELILIALYLDGTQAEGEGAKLLKRWRHDRASFKVEDAKLAQSFARMERDLRATAGSVRRILRQAESHAAARDLPAMAATDHVFFAAAFAGRYPAARTQGK